ncbi:MAG: hypothetical protein KF789_09650 [Bdellovibrionaceae bacterium]|nr:hypothetical protein [Pseudobdellovibrionaceae bacterium]
MTLLKGFSTVLMVSLLGLSAQAQNVCFMQDVQVETIAGTNVSQAQQKILQGDYSTAYTKGLSEDQILERILSRIKIYPTSSNPLSDEDLAVEIYRASKAFGLDPFVMAAKIETESDFIVKVNNKNGTGLTQMTSIAVEEMTYQYEKKDVGGIFHGLSSRFYENKSELSQWMSWAKQRVNSYSQKKQILSKNYKYSLSAGASVLKFYLARNGGNYGKALASYNGGGTAGYSKSVMGLAHEIDMGCAIPENVLSVLEISCAMSDSQEGCDSMAHEILGTRPAGKEI